MRTINCTTGYDSHWTPRENVHVFDGPEENDDLQTMIEDIHTIIVMGGRYG